MNFRTTIVVLLGMLSVSSASYGALVGVKSFLEPVMSRPEIIDFSTVDGIGKSSSDNDENTAFAKSGSDGHEQGDLSKLGDLSKADLHKVGDLSKPSDLGVDLF